MNKISPIYIAGHGGLVESALMRSLQAAGYEHTITRDSSGQGELNLADRQVARDFFAEVGPECVFIAEPIVDDNREGNGQRSKSKHVNLAIQNNLIDEDARSGVRRLVFVGSSCIYPPSRLQPLREENYLGDPMRIKDESCAMETIAAIEKCWSHNRRGDAAFCVAISPGIYGRGDSYSLETSCALHSVLRKSYLAKLATQGDLEGIALDEKRFGQIPPAIMKDLVSRNGPSIRMNESESERREFLFADDLARACVHLMEMPDADYAELASADSPPLVNVGSGENLEVRQLLDMVRETVGPYGKVLWDPDEENGASCRLLNSDRMRSLGWAPQVSLKEGIAVAYQDYLSRQEERVFAESGW